MAGDWIKVETVTPDKPELVRMAKVLGIDQDAVFGKLFRVWAWADQNIITPDDDTDDFGNAVSVTSGVSETFLDRLTFCPGFASAMQSVGWVIATEDGIELPNFTRHNGKSAKTRALTAKRVASHKEKTNAKGNDKVTPQALANALPREEKRTEEKKEQKKKSTETTFRQWQESIPAEQEAFPEGHAIHAYMDSISLPPLFRDIAWFWFADYYADKPKTQKDWGAAFRNSIKLVYSKAWGVSDNGEYYLTATGKQLRMQMEASA